MISNNDNGYTNISKQACWSLLDGPPQLSAIDQFFCAWDERFGKFTEFYSGEEGIRTETSY